MERFFFFARRRSLSCYSLSPDVCCLVVSMPSSFDWSNGVKRILTAKCHGKSHVNPHVKPLISHDFSVFFGSIPGGELPAAGLSGTGPLGMETPGPKLGGELQEEAPRTRLREQAEVITS